MLEEILGRHPFAEESRLVSLLFRGHVEAAKANNNLSRAMYLGALGGSHSRLQAVAAGLLSTGGAHAPISQARELLFSGSLVSMEAQIRHFRQCGLKLPGFGNSFFKDRIDPAFQPVYDAIKGTAEADRLHKALAIIQKPIHPNAAGLTAAVASILNLPPGMELWLFIAPRTAAWLTL